MLPPPPLLPFQKRDFVLGYSQLLTTLLNDSVVISIFAIVILSVLGSLYGVRSLAPRSAWPRLAPSHRLLLGFPTMKC